MFGVNIVIVEELKYLRKRLLCTGCGAVLRKVTGCICHRIRDRQRCCAVQRPCSRKFVRPALAGADHVLRRNRKGGPGHRTRDIPPCCRRTFTEIRNAHPGCTGGRDRYLETAAAATICNGPGACIIGIREFFRLFLLFAAKKHSSGNQRKHGNT